MNAPRVFRDSFPTDEHSRRHRRTEASYSQRRKDTAVLSSASTGFKYNLFGNVLLTGNVLFRLDNKGLRQDVMPLLGLSYAFGGR